MGDIRQTPSSRHMDRIITPFVVSSSRQAFIVIAVISMEIIMISFMAMGARAKLFGKDSAFRKSEAVR